MDSLFEVTLMEAIVKSVLVTGFGPFQGESLNPSGELLERLKDNYQTLVLPVAFEKSWAELESYLQVNSEVQMLVALGQAGGRTKIGLERIAVNLMDSEVADESGALMRSQAIENGGPEAFLSKLPLRDWVQGGSGYLEISNSAGLFVCNSVYYRAQKFLRARGGEALFVHLPYQLEQLAGKPAGTPGLSLQEMELTIRYLLDQVQSLLRIVK